MPGLRLALVGAFNFPAPQGSQVFARDQAAALASAGAEVRMFCYGNAEGDDPPGVEVVRIGSAVSPRGYRSGLHPKKPLADALLVAKLRQSLRARPVDAVLAHNAEAGLVALLAGAAPVVYVAHTLAEEELGAYLPAAAEALTRQLGRAIDRQVAARVEAVIALSDYAAEKLRSRSSGPVEVVPPGVALQEPPEAAEVAACCARHGLPSGEFVLYAGNLDAYQELELLQQVAARMPDRVFAIATHEKRAEVSPLRAVQASADEIRTLTHGAALAVATRRRRGGFPIKLLNYMEAGRAIVAREGQAESLEHDRNACLVDPDADDAEFAGAIESMLCDRTRAARLGRAARATLESEHDWQRIARDTLALVERITLCRRKSA